MEQIFNARSQVFSGRYDAASVCTVLATLDETNLRSLRDRLHAVLPEQVPAAGGRPMIKRKSGSISRLVDDCWALGSSAAQGLLTRFAESQTLRAAERSPPLESGGTSSMSPDLTAIRSSIEALIATQLRLEREVATLRNHSREQDRRLEALTRDLELTRLHSATEERRTSAMLNSELRSTVQLPRASHVTYEGQNVSDFEAESCVVKRNDISVLPSPVSARPPLPPPGGAGVVTCGPSERQESCTPETNPSEANQNSLAEVIAAKLDLRSLGKAIVSAMQAQTTDSDSETGDDEWLRTDRPGQAGRNAPMRLTREGSGSSAPTSFATRCTAHHEPAPRPSHSLSAGAANGLGDLASRPEPITGIGAPSHLVGMPADGDQRARATYVLEGISPEATDSQVRAMVSPVVQRLHDFRRLDRHAAAATGLKAYRIQVDPDDDPWVMNPVNWPAGLRVRRWTVKQKQRQRPFPAATQSSGEHRQRHSARGEGRVQWPVRGPGSTRVWFNRNALHLQ